MSQISGRPMPLPVEAAGATPALQVSVEAIEIVQAVQDQASSVRLVAGKDAIARVYMGTVSASDVTVRGELLVTRPGATAVSVSSLNAVTVAPADNGNLSKKRENEALSLNFRLPAQLITAGATTVKLNAAINGQTGLPLVLTVSAPKSCTFLAGPPLRLRLLGIRYRTAAGTRTFAPRQLDVDLVLSWLRRAYPVPTVQATYAVVDSNSVWPFTSTDVNLQLAAIRAADIAAGVDRRTHYYGLVDDANSTQFMRGSASSIPSSPDPSAVASGPTGSNTWGWDFDGSYGDWYTGHELGHTFGRFHPGFCNGNSQDDPSFPYPNGQLSGTAPAYVGFDVGDPAQGIPMSAMAGTVWHDVMTYCNKQWMSAYTYEGIRTRILAEDQQFSPSGAIPSSLNAAEVNEMTTKSPSIAVIGWVNPSNSTGAIRYVVPSPATDANAPQVAELKATVKFKGASGEQLSEQEVAITMESCQDVHDHEPRGIVNAKIKLPSKARSLELWFKDKLMDTFKASKPPTDVANVRLAPPPLLVGAAETSAEITTGLVWDSPEAADAGVTYTVQVRRSAAEPWQTISVGRPKPELNIDRSNFSPNKKIQVRVTATNGFSTTKATESEIELN